LLIVPGLHDSGPTHWQSWLQSLERDAVRVEQRNWSEPDLDRWAARIASTLERSGPGRWIAVAHSFGCLALARHLGLHRESPIAAALLVAPADPDRFGVAGLLPAHTLVSPSCVVSSDTDPWMSAAGARALARRWGAHCINLGDAGHINAQSGFGPLPLARRWVLTARQQAARRARPQRADLAEWSFAV
jgi:predicted alpha/beta hydrolase family esterase